VSAVVVTANLDFVQGHNREYVTWLCDHADIVCLQEAKDVNLDVIAPADFMVKQDRSSPARAGSAILTRWRFAPQSRPVFLGAHPSGAKMLTRYVARTSLWIGDNRGEVWAAHMPPGRYRHLWARYMHRIQTRIDKTTLPVVIGLDANQPIRRFGKQLGQLGYGHKIDGFVATTGAHISNVRVDHTPVQNGWSDHPAIFADLSFGQRIDNPKKARRYIQRLEQQLKKRGLQLPRIKQ
jgi:hypothetical protein